jgi:hypothetical protein
MNVTILDLTAAVASEAHIGHDLLIRTPKMETITLG